MKAPKTAHNFQLKVFIPQSAHHWNSRTGLHRESERLHSPVVPLYKHLVEGACVVAPGLPRPVGSAAFRLDQGRRGACRL
jgi:hypothetical protein